MKLVQRIPTSFETINTDYDVKYKLQSELKFFDYTTRMSFIQVPTLNNERIDKKVSLIET